MPKSPPPESVLPKKFFDQEERNREIAILTNFIEQLGGFDPEKQTRILRTVIVFYKLHVDLMPSAGLE